MEFIIVTGLSGAGKTNALHAMEDIGFYCVDNLPPVLLSTFYDLCEKSNDSSMQKVAIGVDVRSGDMFADIGEVINACRLEGKRFKILFLEAKPDTLLIRYKESRRKHPLSDDLTSGRVEDAVELEREMLRPVKAMSDFIIDTSTMDFGQLKERIATLFNEGVGDSLIVSVLSFGFKYGIPLEADLVIDVRCLPNPYYVQELKSLTGLDEAVRAYVMQYDVTHEFLDRLMNFVNFTVPLYKAEGKSELVIAIGCTGGKHRSVTVARYVNAKLIEGGQSAVIHHRDIWKA